MSTPESAPIANTDTAKIEAALIRARSRRGDYAALAGKALHTALNNDEELLRMIGLAFLSKASGVRLSLGVDFDFVGQTVTLRSATTINHSIPAIVEVIPT